MMQLGTCRNQQSSRSLSAASPLFAEETEIRFTARGRVSRDDAEEMESLPGGRIHLDKAIAVAGINASGKTSLPKDAVLAHGGRLFRLESSIPRGLNGKIRFTEERLPAKPFRRTTPRKSLFEPDAYKPIGGRGEH